MSSAGWCVTVEEREAFWEKKQESMFGKLVDTLLKWTYFIPFCFSLWLQVEIYKTVKMHCIWHKQMVSSYYFYLPQCELSYFEEVFLRTASGTDTADHDCRHSRKIDWLRWKDSKCPLSYQMSPLVFNKDYFKISVNEN